MGVCKRGLNDSKIFGLKFFPDNSYIAVLSQRGKESLKVKLFKLPTDEDKPKLNNEIRFETSLLLQLSEED